MLTPYPVAGSGNAHCPKHYGQPRERLPGSAYYEVQSLAELPALLGSSDRTVGIAT